MEAAQNESASPEAKSYGVKETKEALDLVLALIATGVDATKDGKVDFNDIPLLLGVFPKIQPALDGAGALPKELGDLSADEAKEIIAHVMGKLAIDDAKAVAVIGAALEAISANYKLYKAIKA